jgi:hypothetical protein
MIELLALAASLSDFRADFAPIRAAAVRTRAERVRVKADDLAQRIAALTNDLLYRRQDAEQLRRDLFNLRPRLQRYNPAQPNSDPALRYDVQRISNAVRILAQQVRERSSDLRWIASQAEKDPALEAPARDLVNDALDFDQTARDLRFEADGVLMDLRRDGFGIEAMDVDVYIRDVQNDAQTILNDAETLLMKVRGG